MDAVATTTIGRARVTGVPRAGEALATRLAVAGMLAGADLRPSGLPPAAILIVNRLALPADRRLPVRPGARLDPAWERAARAAMADLCRRAARPMDGPPPPGCQAVLFRDEAEMLACLALDICLGRTARWWWQRAAQRWGSLTARILAPLLASSPRSTPAALRLLAESDAVGGVLQRLTPEEARLLLRALCAAFDVPRLELSAPRFTGRPPQPAGDAPPAQSDKLAEQVAPWRRFVPPALPTTELTPEHVCLLGVALTLANAPSVAQDVAYVQAVERWWQVVLSARRVVPGPEQGSAAHPPGVQFSEPTVAASQTGHGASRRVPPGAPLPAVGQPGPVVAPVAVSPRPRSAPEQTVAHPNDDLTAADVAAEPLSDRSASRRDDATEFNRLDEGDPTTARRVEAVDWLDGVATDLGGVLFLINLMQRLDLPGCFESDWQLASRLGPWAALELLARGLLAAELPPSVPTGDRVHLVDDPMWAVLAGLAGRAPGELPGGALMVPERLRVPAGWTRWLGTDRDGADPGENASLSLATTVPAPAPLDRSLLVGVSRDLRVWLAWVTPLLRAMLVRALGDDFDIVSGLLLRRGQLYVTSSHVDLVLPLAAVSMLVRIAGLDFDPGWLPAFGRVVQFHYE